MVFESYAGAGGDLVAEKRFRGHFDNDTNSCQNIMTVFNRSDSKYLGAYEKK